MEKNSKTAYEVIAEINGLTHVKENIFIDKDKNLFYLNKYGFHTVIELSNIKLIKERKVLEIDRKIFNLEKHNESINISKRKQRVIKDLLKRNISDIEKLRIISDILTPNDTIWRNKK